MGANLKRVFVIDVEATCWETREEQGDKPNELIEIGVAILDLKSNQVVERGSVAVKPRFTEVSHFCTTLTGWTQGAVDVEGLDPVVALDEFQKQFNPTSMDVWFSYGEYDRIKLSSLSGKAGVSMYGIPAYMNPFDKMRGHYNAKTLMALKHRLPKELGMSRALAYYNETLEGRHHNGADDAFNIAKIVRHVLS